MFKRMDLEIIMALELVQAGIQPLGQFDGYDALVPFVVGGEVGTLIGIATGQAVDHSAYDASGADGYVGGGAAPTRPVVTFVLASGSRPLFLLDDGVAGYGTMFGSVLGGTTGQIYAGAVLGPSTATGSGKITCWDKPGTYAVTLNAADTAADGLVPTNAALAVGAALYATVIGRLTPAAARSFEPGLVIGRLINFETLKGGSLVNTPTFLVSNALALNMVRAVVYFAPPIG